MYVMMSGAVPYAPVKSAELVFDTGSDVFLEGDSVLLITSDIVCTGRIIRKGKNALQVLEHIYTRSVVTGIHLEYDAIPESVWNKLTDLRNPHPPLYFEMEGPDSATDPDPYFRKPNLN